VFFNILTFFDQSRIFMTKTVYVVTPCMNAAETIDRTIMSVVSQAGDVKIRFHVQDGGSTDGTQALLETWQDRLRSGAFPRHCHAIRFSWVSEPDSGMYDALIRGFGAAAAPNEAFMTWINADDILMPGALALASALGRQFGQAQMSWFGGAVNILRDDMTTISFDRPIPTLGLRSGVCDGTHWDFMQQEGTFFRKWLWSAINPATTIAPMKLAGDWNLWRLMAGKAGFAQLPFALGGFRISEGQLSARQRESYLGEIDDVLPLADRRAVFERLCAVGPVTRRKIRPVQGSQFMVQEETVDHFAKHRFQTVVGASPPWAGRKPLPDRTHATGAVVNHDPVDPAALEFPDIAPLVVRGPGLIALDADWQFPAITEQHAFLRMRDGFRPAPGGMIYVAFPWATLIDKMHNKAPDRDLHFDRLEQFCALLPADRPKVTVCQHIMGRQYLDLFRQAGIDDVFWAHATHDDAAALKAPVDTTRPRLHPFPLYPVQVNEALPEAGPDYDAIPRPHLFSFIGARANKYYLTEARNWILDLLGDDTRGLVVGRDSWHYQKIVYDLQVHARKDSGADTLVDTSAADQFRAQLLNTTFSLCPGGSGPNSIRLWESIGAGAIPVILAGTWAPPGDQRLWDIAVVFCKETPEDIRALPDRLAVLAADPAILARMRHAMRQLWILYGPQGFVTDIQALMLAHADDTADGAIGGLLGGLARARNHKTDGPLVLRSCASALLLHPVETLRRLADNAAPLAQAVAQARAGLDDDAPLAVHFDRVLAHARAQTTPAPALNHGAPPKVCALGRHAHRTPLSYAPIRRLVGDRLTWVDAADQADVILTGFNIDLKENLPTLRPLLNGSAPPKIVVMSEEPLWDITWSGPFTGRAGTITVDDTDLSYSFFGHETSDIYAFDRLPYFILTEDTYALRYSALMAGFANIGAKTMIDRWNAAPIRAAFFAEHRTSGPYGQAFDDRDVAGLSLYRTEIAAQSQGAGVLRVGKGWGAEVRRQDLPDWHLDKLAQLQGRSRIVSSYENVHQNAYISEKIFDAFAVGGIPTYWAGPNHRIFDLVPEAAMLNTRDQDCATAAARIAEFEPDFTFAEAWLATCARLADLFADIGALQAERKRVAKAALDEVLSVV